jgi:hypothetical protein
MAKISKASDEMIALFDRVKTTTTIKNWLEFAVLQNNKQKELYKIVKASELIIALTEEHLDFAVIFNEEIFDQLPDNMKEMAIIESIAGVSVNENDVVSLEKPNFSTYRGMLQKYGHDPIITLHESIKSLYDAKKQKEDEAKAATKGKRGRKPTKK